MNLQTEHQLRELCDWIAMHPNSTRSEIIKGLRTDASDSTVYRWLNAAIEKGWVTRRGNTSAAAYEATDELRRQAIRRHLAIDPLKRPKVVYNAEWILDYEPNKTQYLRPYDMERLTSRCPIGSAPLSKLNDHEVSMFMCDISYASSRLEGNQYDYASTIQLVDRHIEQTGGSPTDKAMILNHRDAVRYIVDSVRHNEEGFGLTSHTLRGLHAILSQDLLREPWMSGSIRNSRIEIYRSSYLPLEINSQIAQYFEVMAQKASMIKNPYEAAFFLLVHMPYLQPFEDCNKRTSRMSCNVPLLMGGVTPISWMDVVERPRDYTDAVLAVYEHNDTLLLADVFVDCFMRSAERFSLLQRQKAPDPVATRYRQEIKTAIRAQVLDGIEMIPPTIDPADTPDFIQYVDREIKAMSQNEMLGVRYGLTPSTIARWRSTRTEGSEWEVEDAAQPERMRA